MKKKVYLDLNKYIELSRLYYGKFIDDSDILNLISEAKYNEGLIFPICSSHIIELAKHSDTNKRKRLAEVMWLFSDGLILLNQTEILNFEIDKAIEFTFGVNVQIYPPDFLSKNLLSGFMSLPDLISHLNLSMESANFLSLKFTEKENWVSFVASVDNENRLNAINLIINNTKNIAKSINKNRETLSQENEEIIRKANLAMLILDTQDKVLLRLNKYGLQKEDLLRLGLKKITAFYEAIPTYDIEYKLRVQSSKNKEKKTVENDIFDIGFLSNAICYFDIVITEKYWANISKQAKLDIKYNTVVETNLSSLKAYISINNR